MFYLILTGMGLTSMYFYYNINNISFKMIQLYTYLEETYLKYVVKDTIKIEYYDIYTHKKVHDSSMYNNENTLIKVKLKDGTRFLFGNNVKLLNSNFYTSKKNIFSSIELVVDNNTYDCTEFINAFVHSHIKLSLDTKMIEAFILNENIHIDYKNKSILWNIITHKLDMYSDTELYFTIDNYNIIKS